MSADPYEGMAWEPAEVRTMMLLPNAAMPTRMSTTQVSAWRLRDAGGIHVDTDGTFLTPDEARELAAILIDAADQLEH